MTKHRETEDADWEKIDGFFDKAHKAFENGEMDYKQYRVFITHYIGVANNAGIDAVISGMENSLQDIGQNGWDGFGKHGNEK